MHIEVWSDYVCPFCYIGKRRLEQALEETGLSAQTTVTYKAFQLDPNTPANSEESVVKGLAKKYGISDEEAYGMMSNIAEEAKTEGLAYDIDAMKASNTMNAHRLAKLAEREGLDGKLAERLMDGSFVRGEAIGNDEVLLLIAEEIGLSREQAEEMLRTDALKDDVQADIAEAKQLGVQGVPFFVINRKYALSGAQPPAVFANALVKAAEEEGVTPSFQMLNETDKHTCTDDGCDL